MVDTVNAGKQGMLSRRGLLRVKSVEQSIADTDEPDTRLRKDLTTRDLVVFGVSVIVGAGIFTLAASTAGNVAGPSTSLAFVFAAIACGLAALCYAEFASTVPVAGSAYTFSYATFGEFIAWIIGWDLVLEFTLTAAAVARGWALYLEDVIGFAGSTTVALGSISLDWGAVVLIAALTVVLAVGIKLSSRVALVITAIKVGVVVLVIVVGAFYIKLSNYSPFIPAAELDTTERTGLAQSLFSYLTGASGSSYGAYGLLAAAGLLFFAFIGFDIVATTAEETKDPQRALPRGILGSLVIVTVLYLGVSLVLTGMVNYTELAGESTLATAFSLNGITWAQWVINVGALAGLTTVVMVVLLGQIRVTFAMSRDGLLPPRLAHTGRRGTPVRITVIVGAVAAVLAAFFSLDALVEMINIGTLFAFVLVSIGVIMLRRSRPDLKRGFRVPWMPLLPILAVLACGWLMLNLAIDTWIRFAVWMALGIVLYFAYGYRTSRLGRPVAARSPTPTPSPPETT